MLDNKSQAEVCSEVQASEEAVRRTPHVWFEVIGLDLMHPTSASRHRPSRERSYVLRSRRASEAERDYDAPLIERHPRGCS